MQIATSSTDAASKTTNKVDSSLATTTSPQSPNETRETTFSTSVKDTTVDIESAIYQLEETIPVMV